MPALEALDLEVPDYRFKPEPEGTVIKVEGYDKPGNRAELEGDWKCSDS